MPGIEVRLRVREHRADDVLTSARSVSADEPDGRGWRRVTARFGDDRHALGVLWSAGPDVDVLAPAALRAAVADRAAEIARRYA
jgi:predicted DNA-binding transcriptional regulator YafY